MTKLSGSNYGRSKFYSRHISSETVLKKIWFGDKKIISQQAQDVVEIIANRMGYARTPSIYIVLTTTMSEYVCLHSFYPNIIYPAENMYYL